MNGEPNWARLRVEVAAARHALRQAVAEGQRGGSVSEAGLVEAQRLLDGLTRQVGVLAEEQRRRQDLERRSRWPS